MENPGGPSCLPSASKLMRMQPADNFEWKQSELKKKNCAAKNTAPSISPPSPEQ